MPNYRTMDPDEIVTAHFNPSKRIERSRLTGLLLSIREHGILQPLVLTYNLILADGHRRLACANLLKLDLVPVAIYHESRLEAPALWVTLNSDTLNLTPIQWLSAVDAGLPLDTPSFPETLKRRIEALQAMLGKEHISMLVAQGRSPMILDAAQRVCAYCERRGDPEFLKQTVMWLIEVGNAFSVRAAIHEEIPQDVLIEAIEQGHELMRVWDIARD